MLQNPEWIRLGPVPVSIERMVYATVVLMSVLVVYDGWQGLTTYAGVVAVIVAPTLALGVAELFAGSVEAHLRLERPLTAHDWGLLLLDQVQNLLAAVPPLVILGIGWLTPDKAFSTITVILWTGLMTLVVLALLAAARAGIRGWRLAVAGLMGGVAGLIVISLQVVLKPH